MFTIVCAIIILFGIITSRRLLAICVVVLFCPALLAWCMIEKLSAIEQRAEKSGITLTRCKNPNNEAD
jgi:hypothetical protein